MPIPAAAEQIVIQGFLLDENTGRGDTTAVISSVPVPLTGQDAKRPLVLDTNDHVHIRTNTRSTTPDPETGYWALLALSTNDPDLTAYGGRKIDLPGDTVKTIEVPYNAQATVVTEAMAAQVNAGLAVPLLTVGDQVRAIWYHQAAGFTVPSPPDAYPTTTQMLSSIESGIDAHDGDSTAHPDIRALAQNASVPDATTSVKGKQRLLGGTADAPTVPYTSVTGAPTSLPPSGGAGGVLGGTFPNPSFAVDMATQAELAAVAAAKQPIDSDLTTIAALDSTQSGAMASDGSGWFRKTWAQVKTALNLTKSDVGLGNADNTADTSKPVSAAQQAALDGKVGTSDSRLSDARPWSLYSGAAASGQVPTWNGSSYVPQSPAAPGTSTPDATTTSKGQARLLGGTADAPSVPSSAVTGLSSVATTGAYTDLSGKPTIPAAYTDLSGTVPQSALPAIALTEFLGAVASQAAMLALTGQRGDWASRTDRGTDWQLIAEPSSTLASWREMSYPASPVNSVNGRTGSVTGLAEASDSRFTDTRTPTDASVTDAKVAPAAGIAESKLNLASDAAPGTASRRTLGTGAQQAAAGNDSRIVGAAQSSSLAPVATSGSYTDLSNKPVTGVSSVNTRSGAVTGLAEQAAVDAVSAAVATRAPLPEATTAPRTAALGTPSGLLGYTNRYALTGAVIEALPAVTDGAVLAFAVTAGSTASLTLARNGTDYFGDGTSTSVVLAPGDYYFARGQVVSGQGRWRRLSAPLYFEQDAHNNGRYGTISAINLADYMAANDVADTAGMQAAVDASEAMGGATIVGKPGAIFTINGTITISGRFSVDLRGATLKSVAAANTAPMFQAANTTSCHAQLSNGVIQSNNRILELRLSGTVDNAGMSARLENLQISGSTAADFFWFTQVDFVTVSRVQIFGGNRVFVVDSDDAASERDNTQLVFSAVAMIGCNLGFYARGVDKIVLDGFDLSGCSTGLHLAGKCKRISMRNTHVELFGNPSYSYSPAPGRAIYIVNDGTAMDGITLSNCSTLLPSTSAIASFEIEPNVGVNPAHVVFRECSVATDTVSGYAPLRIGGGITWEGRWPFTAGHLIYGPNASWSDIAIHPQRDVRATSPNLLPFARISRPEDMPAESGAIAVTGDAATGMAHGRQIALTSGANAYREIALGTGWHTLMLNGYSTSDDFYVYVQRGGGDFGTVLPYRRLRGRSDGQLFRLPFYVTAADSYRIGLQMFGSSSSGYIGQIEVHRGHVTELSADPTVSRASGAPSTGIYAVADRVRNSTPTAGGTPGWVCVTAPNTFKAEPPLAS